MSKTTKPKKAGKSKCCKAKVTVKGSVTSWYECNKCGKACDVTTKLKDDRQTYYDTVRVKMPVSTATKPKKKVQRQRVWKAWFVYDPKEATNYIHWDRNFMTDANYEIIEVEIRELSGSKGRKG